MAKDKELDDIQDDDLEQMVDPDDLDIILADLGGSDDAMITVKKVDQAGKEELIDRYPPTEFDIFGIRDQYGGGTYKIYGRKDGKIAKGFPKRVHVAAPRNPPQNNNNNQNQDLVRAIQEGFKEQSAQQLRLMEMMISRNTGGEGQSRSDFLEEMIKMKTLFGGGGNQEGGIEKLLEIFQMGMSIGKETGGKDTGLMDVLKSATESFGPAIATALKQHQELVERQSRQGAIPGQTVDQARQQSKQEQLEMSEAEKALRSGIGTLVIQASMGSDTALWADLVVSQVGTDNLVDFVKQGDPLEIMANIDSRVTHYREWFQSLVGEIEGVLVENGLIDVHEAKYYKLPSGDSDADNG